MIHYATHTDDGAAWCGAPIKRIPFRTANDNKVTDEPVWVTCKTCAEKLKSFQKQLARGKKETEDSCHVECRKW